MTVRSYKFEVCYAPVLWDALSALIRYVGDKGFRYVLHYVLSDKGNTATVFLVLTVLPS